jgi:hypothetical protein
MNTKDGNVPHEGPFETQDEEIKTGDIVALTTTALRVRGPLESMTPRALYQLGHPNEFLVMETFKTEEDGTCVVLPCCMYFEDRKIKNNVRPLCKGHPAIYFKRIGRARVPQKGDLTAAINSPFGNLVQLEWKDDPDNPELTANLLGINLGSLVGLPAKWLKKAAEDQKII